MSHRPIGESKLIYLVTGSEIVTTMYLTSVGMGLQSDEIRLCGFGQQCYVCDQYPGDLKATSSN